MVQAEQRPIGAEAGRAGGAVDSFGGMFEARAGTVPARYGADGHLQRAASWVLQHYQAFVRFEFAREQLYNGNGESESSR